MNRAASFYACKGSDPNAPMKGDHEQQVPRSTAPGSKPFKPKGVKSGGAYKIAPVKRAKRDDGDHEYR